MAGRPSYKSTLQRAHALVLMEVQDEIERHKRQLELLKDQHAMLKAMLSVQGMAGDFIWMVEQ